MIENGKTFEMIKDINDSKSVWKLAVLVKIYGLVASHFSDAVVMISGTVVVGESSLIIIFLYGFCRGDEE
jgi:hypothetical protein